MLNHKEENIIQYFFITSNQKVHVLRFRTVIIQSNCSIDQLKWLNIKTRIGIIDVLYGTTVVIISRYSGIEDDVFLIDMQSCYFVVNAYISK